MVDLWNWLLELMFADLAIVAAGMMSLGLIIHFVHSVRGWLSDNV